MTGLNCRLRELYAQRIDEIKRIASEYDGVSKPLLMAVPEGYEQSTVRLMVVGQQTHGWGQGNCWDVDELMSEYGRFGMGERYGKPFLRTSQDLYRRLNPDGAHLAFLWSNLNKVDQKKKRPEKSVEERIAELQLLRKEIQILEPKAVVFFTGPNYDGLLRSIFQDVQLRRLSSEVDERKLSRLEHDSLPTCSYRTYHPHYLWRCRRRECFVEAIVRDINGRATSQ